LAAKLAGELPIKVENDEVLLHLVQQTANRGNRNRNKIEIK
jgi:hypothetical protein